MALGSTTATDDLLDRLARVPWWGWLLAGVLCFGAMHLAASLELPPMRSGPDATYAALVMLKSLATTGQLLLPGLCLAAAAASAVRRQQLARKLAQILALSRETDGMSTLDEDGFGTLLLEAFSQRGYTIIPAPEDQADSGIDLVLRKGNEHVLVLTRHWREPRVGIEVVRSLAQAVKSGQASGGMLLTAGRFTPQAAAYGRRHRIDMVDTMPLARLLEAARHVLRQEQDWEATRMQAQPDFRITVPQRSCPLCGAAMVERMQRQADGSGLPYWGCSRYPHCLGKRAATE